MENIYKLKARYVPEDGMLGSLAYWNIYDSLNVKVRKVVDVLRTPIKTKLINEHWSGVRMTIRGMPIRMD